jgi:hypothetical protein
VDAKGFRTDGQDNVVVEISQTTDASAYIAIYGQEDLLLSSSLPTLVSFRKNRRKIGFLLDSYR